MLKGPNRYFTEKDRQMVRERMTIAVSGEWRGKWDATWLLTRMAEVQCADTTDRCWLLGDGQQDAADTLEDIFMQN